MTEQRISQLRQAAEAAYRRGDEEAEAWYRKELELLTKQQKEG